MLGVVAICLIPLLAVPSLLVVAALELSTPSPVYFDLQQFRFRRHKQYEREQEVGPDFAARAGAYEPPPLTEDEALTALAVQMSLDSAAEAEAGREAAPQELPLAELPAAAPAAAAADAQLAPAGARGEEAPAGGDEADASEATPV